MNDRTERRTMQRYRSRQAGSYCAAGTANHRRHTDTNIQSGPQSRLSTNLVTGEIDMQTIMLTPPNGRVYLMPAVDAGRSAQHTTDKHWCRCNAYSSVTQPSEASFTALIYLYSVPRVAL